MAKKMLQQAMVVFLAGGLLVSVAGAGITYDNVYYDFGTDPGQVGDTSAFVDMSNITASFTGDSILLTKTNLDQGASFAFDPGEFGFSVYGSTIDMRIRRIGQTVAGSAWDVVITAKPDPNWNGAYQWIMLCDDSTSPALVTTNSSMHTYRMAFADWFDVGLYADADPNPAGLGVMWNVGGSSRIQFSLDSRALMEGVEIDFIGVANQVVKEPPIPEPATLGLLAAGGLGLVIRRKR